MLRYSSITVRNMMDVQEWWSRMPDWHTSSLREYSDMKVRRTVTTSNASVTFTVHSDTCNAMPPSIYFLPLRASCLHAGSTVVTLRTTSFKSLKACISFKKFTCFQWYWELAVNPHASPPIAAVICFCSLGTGFTCLLIERNAWRVILSCFLYAFLYRVIRNDCRCFNHFSYTIHFR